MSERTCVEFQQNPKLCVWLVLLKCINSSFPAQKMVGLVNVQGLPIWCYHVFSMYVWVFSGRIPSLPQSEDMHVEHIGDFVCESMSESCVCPLTHHRCVPVSLLIFAERGSSSPLPLARRNRVVKRRQMTVYTQIIHHTKPLHHSEKLHYCTRHHCSREICKRFQCCSLLWEMFLSLDPKFKKEESRSGFRRRGGPSMVCSVRYQAPCPQQL